MCTVTIIPKGKRDFILTSNRDEAPSRTSLAPEIYRMNGTNLLFPKDELSGGTWIGVSELNRSICVLNGGIEPHTRRADYRKSRGVMAKDFLLFKDFESETETYNFYNIEPFTMVLVDWNEDLKFFELIWDGQQKHFTELPLQPKIWSSTTLYTPRMKRERLSWFDAFRSAHRLDAHTILDFHKTAGHGNKDYGVIMDREIVKTTSITQIEKQKEKVSMYYENLQNQSVSQKEFTLSTLVNEQ
ncbi:NRDE family protein [Aestuariivivens sediminicola]|uniref:NRDE family protein n=1 Tax=Aestuariivivens sediminicola TaxID=2913560 RepID=UPI001F55E4B1|nr:NRDE family protein [Aestuariivivens sediminicola]